MRHSLNHISCDSSRFSPDTGHRFSESCFSGPHLCMLTLLSIWTWKLPHQTFSHVRFTTRNDTTDAREVMDWLLFCIGELQGISGTKTSSCRYFREGEGVDHEELPEEESATFSEWNVFIWYKFNITTLILKLEEFRSISVFQFSLGNRYAEWYVYIKAGNL